MVSCPRPARPTKPSLSNFLSKNRTRAGVVPTVVANAVGDGRATAWIGILRVP